MLQDKKNVVEETEVEETTLDDIFEATFGQRVDARQARELKRMKMRHARQDAAAKVKEIQSEAKLDPVDKKELKGSHAERKDKDIDNDGDVDSADDYLHNRRKAVKHVIKKKMKKEEAQIDELSNKTLKSYAQKASAQGKEMINKGLNVNDTDSMKKYGKRTVGAARAWKKMKKEEAEITEARGRPKKAGQMDYTIHPKTKEKMMHNNPAHMKRIENLYRIGTLKRPKIEAGQNIITQLRKASTSMRGGETINFTHGSPKYVSAVHASKLLDKHAAMKPYEKEAYQKEIGHSHAKLKKYV